MQPCFCSWGQPHDQETPEVTIMMYQCRQYESVIQDNARYRIAATCVVAEREVPMQTVMLGSSVAKAPGHFLIDRDVIFSRVPKSWLWAKEGESMVRVL